MPRQTRLIIPGLPHHIVQRGHNRQAIFSDARDYQHYLDNLVERRASLGIAIYGYCLMPDRVHIIAGAPDDTSSIPRLMKHLAGQQTRFVNSVTQRSGSLWESRYRISPIDAQEYLLYCCRYVDLAPATANLVSRAEEYCWSSCAARLGLTDSPWLDNAAIVNLLGTTPESSGEAYRTFLESDIDSQHDELIELAIQRNKLTGGPRFIDEIERQTGMRIEMRGRGRPRKMQNPRCAQTS